MKEAEIIYEDNHLIAINKPAGFLVQGDKTGDETILEVLKQYIKTTYNKPGEVFLAPNHRLDRPVSGVLLFSKTSKALSRVNVMFQKNQIRKQYYAITDGIPDEFEGRLVHYIAKNRKKNISFITSKGKLDSRECILTYRVVKVINRKCLIEVVPETGRSHQIRVQLASIGAPIVGDLKYGAHIKMEDRSIGLHCHTLEFEHPVKKETIHIEASVPELNIWRSYFQ